MAEQKFPEFPSNRDVDEILRKIKRDDKENVDDILGGIEFATHKQEEEIKAKGLKTDEEVKEYERQHGRRLINKITEQAENSGLAETKKAKPFLGDWVVENIPEELRKEEKIVRLFKEISLRSKFLNVWNYQIEIPEGKKSGDVILHVVRQIINLEQSSKIILNSKDIYKGAETIPQAINFIITEIGFRRKFSIKPTKSVYNISLDRFKNDVYNYLIVKLLIEKLEEILDILENYEPVD